MAANNTNKEKNKSKDDCKDSEIKIPKLPLRPSDMVVEAIEEAELLLSYDAERGLEILPEEVWVITEAKRALENNEWNTEIEMRFWMVYRELARRSYPVTVDSVKASKVTKIKKPTWWQRFWKKERRDTLAARTVKFYTFMTIVTLVIMVALHILFSVGTIRLNRIQMSDEKLKEIDKQLDELNAISGMDINNQSIELRKEKLMDELYEVNSEKENAIRLLEDWLRFIKKLTFSEKNFNRRLESNTIQQQPGMPGPPTRAELIVDTRIGIIQEAQNYVMILGWYILPLFYGLLGALAFVLRDLSNATKKKIFTRESNITHTLRLMLGTIAGLAVGVFWGEIKQQESFVFVRTLGPLLVAFLSGFMVEYLFAIIEQWMRAILERAVKAKEK